MRTRYLIIVMLALALPACGGLSDPAPPPDSGLQAVTFRPPPPTSTPVPTPPGELITDTPAAHTCTDEEVAETLGAVPDYHPGSGSFVTAGSAGFLVNGKPFVARGINYYPARSPWQRFPNSDLAAIERDFVQLRQANVNTVRLFVWQAPMFTCGAVPDPAAFNWLDSVIRLVSAHGFRTILTLNHLPEQRLYTSRDDSQMAYIVNRYRDEPAILAWDLRDAGDADYTPFGDSPAPFTRAQVLDWLARAAADVRQIDPNHLITAGWDTDSESTIPLVDFVSFQHNGDDKTLRVRIAELRSYTSKPLLLTSFGLSTYSTSEVDQAQWLRATVRAAEADRLAGWLVWTMYDFPPEAACWPEPCASLDGVRLHYGLWYVDAERKPAANAFETLAGQK